MLEAALRLIDEHGLAALSMRRLAADLGVEAMSLYHHVRNKADLLDGVAAQVFEQIPVPDSDLSWNTRFSAIATGAYRSFSAHPEVIQAISINHADPRSPGALRVIDALLGTMLDAGLDEQAAAHNYCSLFELIFTSVRARSTERSHTTTENSRQSAQWHRRHVDPEHYPSLHRVLPALMNLDRPDDFEAKLTRFVKNVRSGPP